MNLIVKSFCLSLCFSPSLFHSLSFFLTLYFSLSLSLFFSPFYNSLALSLSLYLCLSLFISLNLSDFLSLSNFFSSPTHTFSLYLCLFFSHLSHTLSSSHSISLFCFPHTNIRVSSPSSPGLLTQHSQMPLKNSNRYKHVPHTSHHTSTDTDTNPIAASEKT